MQITLTPRFPQPKTSQLIGMAEGPLVSEYVSSPAKRVIAAFPEATLSDATVGLSLGLNGRRCEGHRGNEGGCYAALHQSYP